MTLQFILGKASDNHFKKVVDNLQTGIKQEPADQYFYVVPNNVKFESELNTLKQLNVDDNSTYAQNQVQIFSFSRLIWYFMHSHPDYQLPQLSQTAINMIIYQIIEDNEENLTIYRGEGKQAGFIQQVSDQISELQQGNVSPDDLDHMANLEANVINPELRSKLHDISLIYREFLQQTDGQYIYNAATFEMLNQYLLELPEAEISKMHFYFSNFEKFSAQELQIIQTLIQRAHVVMDLNLDHKYDQEMPNETDFFYQSGKLYHYLYQYARKNSQVLTDQYAGPRELTPGLKQLEDYWIASNEVGTPIPAVKSQNANVHVTETNTSFDELMQVAIKIRQLVANGNYRYSDFLVVARHLDQYENIIDPIFSMQQLPYFTDIQKHMDDHPLVELLDALFSIYRPNRAQNYRYDDVMGLLKSELLIPRNAKGKFMSIKKYRHYLALCENLVLKNGYQGKRWLQQEDWLYAAALDTETGIVVDKNKKISAEINQIRHFVKDTLPPFYRRINKAKTGRAAAKILYQFLVQNGVPDQLKNWQSQATEAGNLQEAGQAEQVWNQFCQLLDDYVTVLGDHEFVMDDFLDLLKAGFVGASYSQIPSTLDQVTISETGRIHLNDKKITFVIGADDNNIPAKVDNNSLFNDADRDQMDVNLEDDQYLVDTSETMMLGEPYEDYLTFLNPDNELYFSYNLGGDGADTIHQISPYVKRIQDYFGIKTEKFSGRPTAEEVNISQYVGSDRTSLKYLIQAALASKKNKQPLNSAWGTVKQQLEQHSDRQIRDLTKNLLGSLDYQNSPKKLRPEIISGLYGNDIVTSISKLEEFYTDPYEYFLKYGLKLRERDEFEISPANTGQFYHEALDRIVKEINKQQLQLPDLTDQDIHELVTEITSKMIEADVNYQYEILKSSQRMCYITSQLVATVNQMALTMRNQAQHVNMRPKKTEVAFGPGQKYAPLHFDLNDKGQQVNVQGRIDRIDEMKVDDIDYLGIVDYKSGNRDINLSEVYDGTSMQMMTYLDAVLQNITSLSDSEQAELAGALYLHIFDPILKPGEVKNWNEPKQIERELLKKHKYNGLLVSDKTMLKKMGNGDVNAIYPFDFKNNGDLKVTSKVITRDNLQLMLQHTERLIQNAARRIFAGDIQLAPAKYEKQSLIQYSPYKAIMQFDPMLRENNYREIQKLTDQQIWDLLRKEAGEKNE